jgi:hypothetical protein
MYFDVDFLGYQFAVIVGDHEFAVFVGVKGTNGGRGPGSTYVNTRTCKLAEYVPIHESEWKEVRLLKVIECVEHRSFEEPSLYIWIFRAQDVLPVFQIFGLYVRVPIEVAPLQRFHQMSPVYVNVSAYHIPCVEY